MIKQPATASHFAVKQSGQGWSLQSINAEPEFTRALAWMTDIEARDLANNILTELKTKRKQ